MKRNKLPEHLKPKMTTIKNKMLSYTFLIILLMSILSIYSLTITNVYKQRIDTMFQRNVQLNEITDLLETVDNELVVYLSTKSSTSLNNYMLNSEKLKNSVSEILDEVKTYSEEELMVLDIDHMVFNYLLETEKSVAEKRRSDVVAYTDRYKNTFVIKGYIELFINELNVRQLDTNAGTYIYMTEQVNNATLLNVILIIDLVLLSIIIVLRLTNNMLNPIVRLSHSAEDMSKGRFNTEDIVVETNDEIEILAVAFNRMKLSIHTYIEELKEKAFTEAKLKDQQMENLKMQSLLDNARLYALQSQMNPHFLFNTINAAVQLSMIEGADRTSEFLESMSRLFRYNIKQLDKPVTIGDEVANIKDYYELLKVRFGELIKFQFIIDESSLDYLMPPLILQPIVENAYIHGLTKKEEGGSIKVQILNEGDSSTIVIEDTGAGISRKGMKKIMSHHTSDYRMVSQQDESSGSNGIGLRNVIERLELFYKEKGLFTIQGSKNVGTKVTIKIPRIKEKRHD